LALLRSLERSRRFAWAIALILLAAGLAVFFLKPAASVSPHPNSIESLHTGQPQSLAAADAGKWVCPMHPHIVQDHPDTCPICGMDLVKVEKSAGSSEQAASGVKVDTATAQRLGVRLAKAEMRPLAREIRTYGTFSVDQVGLWVMTSKVQGWIKKMHVDFVGEAVREGQVLYEIHSPALLLQLQDYVDLVERQDKYLKAKPRLQDQRTEIEKNFARDRQRLYERLILSDVDEQTLRHIEKTYQAPAVIPVRAPHAGHVQEIRLREGSQVGPMDAVLSLARTKRVWVEIVLYPEQVEWLRNGDRVVLHSPHLPGGKAIGRLALIDPFTDAATRAVRGRIILDNPKGEIPIGAYVDVTIRAREHQALAVPRSAVIRTGRGDRVMLAMGDGRFVPTAVNTGVESEDWTEISDGLREGAQVAANGHFLLDAAASLNDALWRSQSAPAHSH